MSKWLLVSVLLTLVLGLLQPWFARLLSRLPHGLPGDLHWRYRGRNYYFPFTSTLLLTLAAWLLVRWL